MSPAMIGGDHEHDQRADRDRERRVLDRDADHQREHDARAGCPSAAPSSAVITLSWRIIRRTWRRRHPDRAQHPELARALEHGQHERVDDPEQADDDRQRQQHVEQVQQRVEPLQLVVLELRLGLQLGVREAAAARPSSACVLAGVTPPCMFDERVQVLRVLVDGVEARGRDRHVAVGRAALRRREDPAQRQMQELRRSASRPTSGEPTRRCLALA